MKMNERYGLGRLLRFAAPSVVMMLFMSLYTVADGMLVSRIIGPEGLSAVNISYPLTSAVIAIGLMFATGGAALISYELGAGNTARANALLSLMCLAALALALVFTAVFLSAPRQLLTLLGTTEELYPMARDYFCVLSAFIPLSIFQLLFQSYFVSASKPLLGFSLTVAGGVLNIALDWILMAYTPMGIAGAAVATGLGYGVVAVGGAIYFARNRGGLRFGRPRADWRALGRAAANGSSEMVNNLSACVTTLLFNLFMMRMLGVKGVAAISVVLYAQFLLSSAFLGFSMGVAPLLSYRYGEGKGRDLKRMIRICATVVGVLSVAVTLSAYFAAPAVAKLFAGSDAELCAIITRGQKLFSAAFLFMGANIFASALLTALGNGFASAAVSFARTLLFTVLFICVLPRYLEIDGLWLAIPLAEAVSVLFAAPCLFFGLRKDFRRLPAPTARQ